MSYDDPEYQKAVAAGMTRDWLDIFTDLEPAEIRELSERILERDWSELNRLTITEIVQKTMSEEPWFAAAWAKWEKVPRNPPKVPDRLIRPGLIDAPPGFRFFKEKEIGSLTAALRSLTRTGGQ